MQRHLRAEGSSNKSPRRGPVLVATLPNPPGQARPGQGGLDTRFSCCDLCREGGGISRLVVFVGRSLPYQSINCSPDCLADESDIVTPQPNFRSTSPIVQIRHDLASGEGTVWCLLDPRRRDWIERAKHEIGGSIMTFSCDL